MSNGTKENVCEVRVLYTYLGFCLDMLPSSTKYVDEIILIISDVVILIPFVVVGLIGNTLAFVVLNREKRKSNSSMYMKMLAITDNAVLISRFIYASCRSLYKYVGVQSWYWGYELYQVTKGVNFGLFPLFRLCSLYIVMIMTVERFIVVCKPMKAKSLCTSKANKMAISVMVCIAIILNVPHFFRYQLFWKCCVGRWRPVSLANEVYENNHKFKPFYQYYEDAEYFMMVTIIPFSVTGICNYYILSAVRQASERRATMSGGHDTSQDKSITRRILFVSTATVILELPYFVLKGSEFVLDHIVYDDINMIDYLFRPAETLLAINSSINIFVYLIASKMFRNTLKNLFRFSPKSDTPGSHSHSLSNINSTCTQGIISSVGK